MRGKAWLVVEGIVRVVGRGQKGFISGLKTNPTEAHLLHGRYDPNIKAY